MLLLHDTTEFSFQRMMLGPIGMLHKEVVGKDIALIFSPEDRKAHVPAREREIAAREGRADDERWHVTRDERRVYCSGVVTPISTLI